MPGQCVDNTIKMPGQCVDNTWIVILTADFGWTVLDNGWTVSGKCLDSDSDHGFWLESAGQWLNSEWKMP